MHDASTLEINLSALSRNIRTLRRIVGPDCHLCPVIKADAYGLGATRIGQRLAECDVRMVAVYSPDQAAELFRHGVPGDVLLLMPVRDIPKNHGIHAGLVTGRLHVTGHDPAHIRSLGALARHAGATIPVHLEIDTGLHRGGCSIDDVEQVVATIATDRGLRLAGLFTHFANSNTADPRTIWQIDRFRSVLRQLRSKLDTTCLIHVASTMPTLRDPGLHQDMVRFGLGWIGYGPEYLDAEPCHPAARDLQPILTWASRIVQTRTISVGEPVGYHGRWTARRPTRLGLIPIGYADGYPTALAGTDADGLRGWVTIANSDDRRVAVPVVGAVSMDQITVDLTDAPHVQVDTRVELISPDRAAPNHVPTLARTIGIVPHELLCRLNSRIQRIYHSHPSTEIEILPSRTAVAS